MIFTEFLIEHPYVAESDFQELAGHLNIAVAGADQTQVETYFLEFGEYQRQLMREIRVGTKSTEEAWGEKLARMSTPVADYIVPEVNPVARVITAKLMPIFIVNTQMVIADEFHDKPTLEMLRVQMETVRQGLKGRIS